MLLWLISVHEMFEKEFNNFMAAIGWTGDFKVSPGIKGFGRSLEKAEEYCEVQILMKRCIEIKKFGHTLYQLER